MSTLSPLLSFALSRLSYTIFTHHLTPHKPFLSTSFHLSFISALFQIINPPLSPAHHPISFLYLNQVNSSVLPPPTSSLQPPFLVCASPIPSSSVLASSYSVMIQALSTEWTHDFMGCTPLTCLSCSSRCGNPVNREIHLVMWFPSKN